jgi:hypothetical protein
LASPELDAILAAIFDAEFCPPGQKQAREQTRDSLLQAQAERAAIPPERLKLTILSSRYVEYRRRRLAHEMPSVPPGLRDR